MIGRFLRGEFDPEHRRVKALERLVVAKLNKPETVKAKVDSDWAFATARSTLRAIRTLTKLPKGVARSKNGKFQAKAQHDGKWIYLGTYDTEQQAAEASLTASRIITKEKGITADKVIEAIRKPKVTALPKFVYYHKAKDRYIIQRRTNGKDIHYGTFKVLEEAIDKLTELGFVE